MRRTAGTRVVATQATKTRAADAYNGVDWDQVRAAIGAKAYPRGMAASDTSQS
jgi:hypothetical protein